MGARTGECHKTLYLGMMVPISPGLLILYSKNVLGLSDNFYGSLAQALVNFRAVLHVSNLLGDSVLLLLGLVTLYHESLITATKCKHTSASKIIIYTLYYIYCILI